MCHGYRRWRETEERMDTAEGIRLLFDRYREMAHQPIPVAEHEPEAAEESEADSERVPVTAGS